MKNTDKILDFDIDAENGFAIKVKDILDEYNRYDPEIAISTLFFVIKKLVHKIEQTENELKELQNRLIDK